MKKFSVCIDIKQAKVIISILLFFTISLFGLAQSTSDTKELGFIIFVPDRAVFDDEIQAKELLDQFSKKIKDEVSSKEIQIHINGYAADFKNIVDSYQLSFDRANIVFHELVSKGISKEKFNIVKGNGGTSKWGNNEFSESRKPNRRVTVNIITEIIPIVETTIEPLVSSTQTEIITLQPSNTDSKRQSMKTINWKRVVVIIAILLVLVVVVVLLIKFAPNLLSLLPSKVKSLFPLIKTTGGRIPINTGHAGQKFADGVRCESKIIRDSTGRLVRWEGPLFDKVSKFAARLPKKLYNAGCNEHYKWAEEFLKNWVRSNQEKALKKFGQTAVEIINNTPPGSKVNVGNFGYIWHHHPTKRGLLQLVEIAVHELYKHSGGISIW